MSRSGSTLYLIALLTAATVLTACTPKGSMEQHTRHYVYASDDGFDPNFSTQKADTTRMMVLFFGSSGIWELKIKRQENHGVMCNNAFSSFTARIFKLTPGHNSICGYRLPQQRPYPKKSRLLADTISAVYLDGYES